MVSPTLASKLMAMASPDLASKSVVESFPVWVSKSPRRFLDLCHKINGRMKTVRGTCRDITACFAWKQVGLGFPSLASRLAEV
jgi:hypothetical protein